MARIDSAVAATLNTGIGALTLGTNLFTGPLRPAGNKIPGKAVFVMASGGPQPRSYSDGGSGHTLREPSVQILCRGEAGVGALSDAQTLADLVFNAVEKFKPAGAIGAFTVESSPNYVGTDEQGRHIFSVNLKCWKRSDT